MPRPYKALLEQGYKHYFTAITGRTRIVILRLFIPKHYLSVIAYYWHFERARHASPVNDLT